MTKDSLVRLSPELVAPAVVALAAENAPNGVVLCAGAGSFERAYITLKQGEVIAGGDVAGKILDRFEVISDRAGKMLPEQRPQQAAFELQAACPAIPA